VTVGSQASADDCLFCRIAAGAFGTKFVVENADVVAFADLHPQAPVHVLVIPRRHVTSLDHASADDQALLGKILLATREVAHLLGIAESGFRTVLNTGPNAGQSVLHLHAHVLGGRAMNWPPG
jgi:histidine triad (HIT) family protein